MSSHFQTPWTKWDYVEDILMDLEVINDYERGQLRKGLQKMSKKELSMLYERVLTLKKKSETKDA